jgi:multiple sugar transport system permease protein
MPMGNRRNRDIRKSFHFDGFLPYAFVFPALILTSGILYPFLLSVYYSLTDYRLGGGIIHFVWGRNYLTLLSSSDFWTSLGLTAGYTAAALGIQLSLGLAGAVLLNQEVKGIRVARSLIILPLMMPPVIAALMWKIILAPNGILNRLAGLSEFSWLGGKTTALLAILIIDSWIYTPFVIIILLAGLRSLPQEPFEAARLDGGSGWFVFRNLTVPLLKPFILIAALFRSIDSLKTFDIIYATTKGGPGSSTLLLQVKAYFESFRHYNMGSALSCMIVLWLVIFLLSRFLVKRWFRAVACASGK